MLRWKEFCFLNLVKNDDFSCRRVFFEDFGSDRYYCWVILVKWKIIFLRICCLVKVWREYYCIKSIYYCVVLIFLCFLENLGSWVFCFVLCMLIWFVLDVVMVVVVEFDIDVVVDDVVDVIGIEFDVVGVDDVVDVVEVDVGNVDVVVVVI